MSDSAMESNKGSRKTMELRSQTGTTRPLLRDDKTKSPAVNAGNRRGATKDNNVAAVIKVDDSEEDEPQKVVVKQPMNTNKKQVTSLEVETRLRSRSSQQDSQSCDKDTSASKVDVSTRQHPYRRPKRNLVPKKEAAYGLLWKEEAELQRALNASMQSRKQKEVPVLASPGKISKKRSSSSWSTDAGEDCTKMGGSDVADEDYGQNFTFVGSNLNQSSSCERKTRVRAQRKFASSASQLEVCSQMPIKWSSTSQPQKVINSNGKTEDFLTFLCLRRSSALPPHLECFKYSESESLQSFPSSSPASQGSSCPGTPVSLPGPSGEVSAGIAPSSDHSVNLTTKNLFKKTNSREGKKRVLPNRNSWKVHSFHSTGWTHNKLGKTIRSSLKPRTSASNSKSMPLSPPHMDGQANQATLSHSMKPTSSGTAVKNAMEPVKASNRSKTEGEASLKCRLRPTTQALTAAVIKEQQMFVRRSLDRLPMMTTCSESTTSGDHNLEKTSAARVTRSNSLRGKREMDASQADLSGAEAKVARLEKKNSLAGNQRKAGTDRLLPGAECGQQPKTGQRLPHKSTNIEDLRKEECADCREYSISSSRSSVTSTSSSSADVRSISVSEIPTFRPTAEQLQDFSTYVKECSKAALDYGLCRIIPPDGWKIDCNVSQELRFTPHTQYIHKMTQRWGPNVQQLACITHHIESQGGSLEHIPLVGGVETDMVALSQAVQSCGGIQQVVDKNKWQKVAEMLKLPAVAKEKTSRLYEIYCRYLLSYDTLSSDEKKKLEERVLSKRERDPASFDEPCIVKSRAKSLSDFFCVARNTLSMYFNGDPDPAQVEKEYWRLAEERTSHVAVQLGRIDSWQWAGRHSGSSRKRDAAAAAAASRDEERYLKNLIQSDQGVLRHLTSTNGVTEPVLDIGMLFSTMGWSRDMHRLPHVHYLHTGADVLWYSIPESEESRFKAVKQHLAPDLLEGSLSSRLPSDAVMISPDVLRFHGVRVFRTVQQQGHFIVVFPESCSASISCGYNILEHVNFTFVPDWLQLGYKASQSLEESCEPELFSFEKLLVDLVTKDDASIEELKIALPLLEKIVTKELDLRKQLIDLGLKSKRMQASVQEIPMSECEHKSEVDHHSNLRRCDVSEKLCYLSMVLNEQNDVPYSLGQAVSRLKRRKNLGSFSLLFKFDEFELAEMIEKGWLRVSGRHRSPSKRNADVGC